MIKMIDDPAIMDMMPAGFAEPGQKKYLKEAMKAPGFVDVCVSLTFTLTSG